MEDNKPDSLLELDVDHESRNSFKVGAKWSNFVGIMYIICFGFLMIVALFVSISLLNPDGPLYTETDGKVPPLTLWRGGILIVFLIYAGMMAVRFATYTRRGVEMQDQESFNHGLKGLRNYVIATGVYALWSLATQFYEIFTLFF